MYSLRHGSNSKGMSDDHAYVSFTNVMARLVHHFLNGTTRSVAASGLESFEDLVCVRF
jgi:hypothetical protein